MGIVEIAQLINSEAQHHEVGDLQKFRSRVRGTHLTTNKIFTASTVFPDGEYAFHHGGRTELQFNIGSESRPDGRFFRHGVAFSFETSRTLPTIRPLLPKVKRFNEYVRNYREDFIGFRMWHWCGSQPSLDSPVTEIVAGLMERGCFVFIGRRVPVSEVDVREILDDFDRLFALYAYVESGNIPSSSRQESGFRPGCVVKTTRTTASLIARQVDVDLRHNELQVALFEALQAGYPGLRIGTEYRVAAGAQVDVAVEMPDGFAFYEIKVAPTVRAAMREAIGQLLDYSHWPTESRATKLIVVGEARPSQADQSYLKTLRTRYRLKLFYRHLDTAARALGPEV